MSTLLLRLAAPLQSWGVSSKFDTRDTSREPTKSGIIGLLAAALGRSRTDRLNDLNALRFGVRIDQPGEFMQDFHTAKSRESSFVTNRHYLADAVFVVALEGEDDIVQELAVALRNPVFPLFLGRRSCPPSGQLVLGIREMGLRQALEEESWQASGWFQKKNSGQYKSTLVYDAELNEPGAYLQRDMPITFSQRNRQYGFRMVKNEHEVIPVRGPQHIAELPTNHNAIAEWEGS